MERVKERSRFVWILLRSLLTAMGVTLALLLLLALILLKLQPDPDMTETGIWGVYAISCMAGGWYCGRNAGQRKFLWGMLSGLLYFALLLLLSGLSTQPLQSGMVRYATAGAVCAAAGMAGGMFARGKQ